MIHKKRKMILYKYTKKKRKTKKYIAIIMKK